MVVQEGESIMKFRLIAFWLTATIALSTDAESPGAQALNASTNDKALSNAAKRAFVTSGSGSFLSIQRYLNLSFRVPVSFEWPYVDSIGSAAPWAQTQPWVRSSDNLEVALNELPAVTGGKLRWSEIRGNICILSPVDAKGTENTLDTIVTIKIQNTSTWEALKALAGEINRQVVIDRRTVIYPNFTAHGIAGPTGFRSGKEVTLELENVTARDVLCAIIEKSQFEMAYTYWTHYRPDISSASKRTARIRIILYEDGTSWESREPMSAEETLLYISEMNIMSEDKTE